MTFRILFVGVIASMACCCAAYSQAPATAPFSTNPGSGTVLGGPNAAQTRQFMASQSPMLRQLNQDETAGKEDMKAGDYAKAESEFRAVLALQPDYAPAFERLAECLVAEGRPTDALAVYHELMFHKANWSGTTQYSVRSDMNYAILLAQAGQWQEAIAMYDRGAASVPGGDTPNAVVSFDPKTPEPIMLQASAHVAIGMDASTTGGAGDTEEARALKEYTVALGLEPQWAVAQFYYAYGQMRLGNRAEAVKLFTKIEKATTDPVLKQECVEGQL